VVRCVTGCPYVPSDVGAGGRKKGVGEAQRPTVDRKKHFQLKWPRLALPLHAGMCPAGFLGLSPLSTLKGGRSRPLFCRYSSRPGTHSVNSRYNASRHPLRSSGSVPGACLLDPICCFGVGARESRFDDRHCDLRRSCHNLSFTSLSAQARTDVIFGTRRDLHLVSPQFPINSIVVDEEPGTRSSTWHRNSPQPGIVTAPGIALDDRRATLGRRHAPSKIASGQTLLAVSTAIGPTTVQQRQISRPESISIEQAWDKGWPLLSGQDKGPDIRSAGGCKDRCKDRSKSHCCG
jgi:hypothetical protein